MSQRLQSHLISRVCRYGGRSRLPYHVVPASAKTTQVSFHSGVLFQSRALHGIEAISENSVEFGYLMPAKPLIVTSSLPTKTKQDDILNQITVVLNKPNRKVQAAKKPAVVLLATPSFARWLDETSFVSKILNLLFDKSRTVEKSTDIKTLLAVVDGLPNFPPKKLGETTGSDEGFAILPCDEELVVPGLERLHDNLEVSNQRQHQKASLIFELGPKFSTTVGQDCMEITVPLANTVFLNGRTSTLLIQRWRGGGSIARFKKMQQVEINSATICTSRFHETRSSGHFDIPLIPLTPPRRVASGLGNIVRQLRDAEGNIVSASQELEASVDAYLDVRKLNKQTVAVWALVIPDSLTGNTEVRDQMRYEVVDIHASWTEKSDPSIPNKIGAWLHQGASLHRVLSGGGGWGVKQGLLSLDPERTLVNSVDARYDFDSGEPVNINQVRALGNIARPNSWIQFMIAPYLAPIKSIVRQDVQILVAETEREIFAFGCKPSSVDEIPQPPSASSAAPMVQVIDGCFGAQSEAGIFIHNTVHKTAMDSKLDVPYSVYRTAL